MWPNALSYLLVCVILILYLSVHQGGYLKKKKKSVHVCIHIFVFITAESRDCVAIPEEYVCGMSMLLDLLWVWFHSIYSKCSKSHFRVSQMHSTHYAM